jgi:hypothetical protein
VFFPFRLSNQNFVCIYHPLLCVPHVPPISSSMIWSLWSKAVPVL